MFKVDPVSVDMAMVDSEELSIMLMMFITVVTVYYRMTSKFTPN